MSHLIVEGKSIRMPSLRLALPFYREMASCKVVQEFDIAVRTSSLSDKMHFFDVLCPFYALFVPLPEPLQDCHKENQQKLQNTLSFLLARSHRAKRAEKELGSKPSSRIRSSKVRNYILLVSLFSVLVI